MASTTAEAAAGTTAGAITEPNRTGGGGMKIPPPLILEKILNCKSKIGKIDAKRK